MVKVMCTKEVAWIPRHYSMLPDGTPGKMQPGRIRRGEVIDWKEDRMGPVPSFMKPTDEDVGAAGADPLSGVVEKKREKRRFQANADAPRAMDSSPGE